MLVGDAGHYAYRALPAPCDDCALRSRCRDERLACEPFEEFVDRGRFDLDAPRRPTRRRFLELFAPSPDRRRTSP